MELTDAGCEFTLYRWQFKEADSYWWENFGPSDDVTLEKLYCDVNNLEVPLNLTDTALSASSSSQVKVHFEEMSMHSPTSSQFLLRRWSTPSFVQEPNNKSSTHWFWYWKDNDGWKKYAETMQSSGDIQGEIEAAYLNEEDTFSFRIGSHNYILKFYETPMYQINIDPDIQTMRTVRRRPVFVSKPTYQTKKSKRERIKRKLKAKRYDQIEKLLFHGTSSHVVDAICKQNFDHRVRGKHGTKYGEGSYFARDASYSNNYSSLSGEKTRFMFLAKVLTGEYTLGETGFLRPPLKDPNNPASDLYDSCVDDENQPQIFVIFNDEQCYPSYLIKYELS
ncbi:TCDD-inducible poly [ADP-ribose] polymerase [Stylophora pistillata]|uniref:Poly [ADP-ribose] polymerase n=1 Tax=Stylophora pistillata TaxID=50429 RepID=A0A2B4RJT4_STYPI|nr:TCDD-inducible poly [ADP-ribose] polymerase [Stylophora pistillata]